MTENFLKQKFLLLVGMCLGLVAGCQKQTPESRAPTKAVTKASPEGAPKTPATNADKSRPIIFAAASLTDVIKGLQKEENSRETFGNTDLNLGSSATIARQIEQGAPADLFFSASTEWADVLAKKELVANRWDDLENTLVLVIPSRSTANIHELKDLAGPAVKRIALADPKSVPAGKYARKALDAEKLWEQVQDKVVAGDDVRQALMYVERGEVDAALVYATDAASNKAVKVVATIEERLTGPIRYSLVLLKRGEQNPAAVACYEFLSGPKAVPPFEKAGFRIRKDSPK